MGDWIFGYRSYSCLWYGQWGESLFGSQGEDYRKSLKIFIKKVGKYLRPTTLAVGCSC